MSSWLQPPRLLIMLATSGVGLSPLVIIALVAVVCTTQVGQNLYQSGQLIQ